MLIFKAYLRYGMMPKVEGIYEDCTHYAVVFGLARKV